jgi:hypothetical protein
MKRWASFLLLPLLAVFATQAGATNLIQNGDFHTGDLTDWTSGLTSDGSAGPWGPEVEGCEAHMGQLCWGGQVGSVVYNGQYEGATMSQTFTSGAGPATLSMFYEVQMLFMGGEGGDFLLLLDGNIVAQNNTGELDSWDLAVGTLAANANLTAGQHTLEIDVLSNVQSDDTSPIQLVGGIDVEGPVPEPGSLVLMGSGVLGLVGVLRRKIF